MAEIVERWRSSRRLTWLVGLATGTGASAFGIRLYGFGGSHQVTRKTCEVTA
jgi:hypothetical protein